MRIVSTYKLAFKPFDIQRETRNITRNNVRFNCNFDFLFSLGNEFDFYIGFFFLQLIYISIKNEYLFLCQMIETSHYIYMS
jgi:hypothetical protein